MPRKDMLVRDENVLPINSTTGHWVNITKRLFSNSLLGKKLRKMQPGSAYKNPGDGKFVHSNINVSDKPIKLFWTRTIAPE